ncbi:MAG: hypothetical protein LBU61_00070 [Coriobacteriales bacterium]|jgi:hypothetical protein|nr:hypothetical protein [Coriobacteriales bacterium]
MFGNKELARVYPQAKGHTSSLGHRLHWPSIGNRGQMTVELAVVFPVALLIVYIMVNSMLFLSACARFDRISAEAVRTMATSPGSDSFGIRSRAADTEAWLERNFADLDYVQISVTANPVVFGKLDELLDPQGDNSVVFSLLPKQECFTCTLSFTPWGMPGELFGVKLFTVNHTREYVIDPYQPGGIL